MIVLDILIHIEIITISVLHVSTTLYFSTLVTLLKRTKSTRI